MSKAKPRNGHDKKNGSNGHATSGEVPEVTFKPPTTEVPSTSMLLAVGKQREAVKTDMRKRLAVTIELIELQYPDFKDALAEMLEGHVQRIGRERELAKREQREAARRSNGT